MVEGILRYLKPTLSWILNFMLYSFSLKCIFSNPYFYFKKLASKEVLVLDSGKTQWSQIKVAWKFLIWSAFKVGIICLHLFQYYYINLSCHRGNSFPHFLVRYSYLCQGAYIHDNGDAMWVKVVNLRRHMEPSFLQQIVMLCLYLLRVVYFSSTFWYLKGMRR